MSAGYLIKNLLPASPPPQPSKPQQQHQPAQPLAGTNIETGRCPSSRGLGEAEQLIVPTLRSHITTLSSQVGVIDLSLKKRDRLNKCNSNKGSASWVEGKSFDIALSQSKPPLTLVCGAVKEAVCRRNRTMFNEWQLSELERRFSKNKYLITSDRLRVAKLLHLNQLQVKTWFQNRRMKWKKQILASGDGGAKSPTKPKGRPKRNSIPPIEDYD